jgi:hypothetical protein
MSQALAQDIGLLFLGGLAFGFSIIAIVNFYRDLNDR